MKTSRRRFLVSASALALLPGCRRTKPGDSAMGDSGGSSSPAPVRDEEPDPWDAPGTEDTDTFAWGVQVGDATPSGAMVSVHTTEASVVLRLARAEIDDWHDMGETGAFETTDGLVQMELSGLQEDTAYSLAMYAADGERRSRVARFRTALGDAEARVLSIGASSCLKYNQPWPTLSHAATEKLDLFLLLGDTIYANSSDLEGYRTEWREALATTGLNDLTAGTSIVATWDDHEVVNDFRADETDPVQVEAALRAFREALPQREGPGGTGIWRKVSWGSVLDVFVLDSRGERVGGSYISIEQMDWLKAGLSDSTARFKLIANSVPITDMEPMFGLFAVDDRWQGFPEQRDEILRHIVEGEIPGVLWLAGDFHYGQVSRVDAPGGLAENEWEVLVGPGGSQLNVAGMAYPEDEQFPLLFADFNWTRLDLDPGTGEVHVTYYGDDGALIREITLSL